MSPTRAPASSRPRWLVPLLALVVVALAAWWWSGRRGESEASAYRTAPVERGEIRTAISATGVWLSWV